MLLRIFPSADYNKTVKMDEFKYCRVCLVSDVKMYSLETKSPDSVGVFYSDLVQAQISDENQHVCFECASLLYKFQEFKSKCLRAHNILSGIKLVTSEITKDTLENVDRKMNKLESTLKINPVVVFYEEQKNRGETELNTTEDKENHDSEIKVKSEDEKYIVIEHYNNLGVDCKYDYNDDSTEHCIDYMEESVLETVLSVPQTKSNKRKHVKDVGEDVYVLSDEMEESLSETATQPKTKKRKVTKIKDEDEIKLSDEMSESVTETATQPKRRSNINKQPKIEETVLRVMGEDNFKLLEEMEESVPETRQPVRRSICKQSKMIKSESMKVSSPKTVAQSKQKTLPIILKTKNRKVIKSEEEDVVSVSSDDMEESDTQLLEQSKQKSKQVKKPITKKSKVIKNENIDDSDPELGESKPESEAKTKQKKKQLNHEIVSQDPNMKKSRIDYSFFDDFATVVFMTPKEAKKELLLRKQSKNYKGSPLKCDLCYTGFELKATYDNHLKRHSPENGEFECDICYLRFPKQNYLRKHKMFSHKKKFSCKLCSFVCYKTDQATNHVNMHQGLRYLCKHCGEEFSMPNTLRMHYRSKHLQETLNESVCQFCGEIFVTLKGLRAHTLRQHKHDKNYKLGPECDDCGVHFTSEMAWKRHLVLSSRHKVSIGCNYCGETFLKEDELTAHLKIHTRQDNTYNSIIVPAACPVCDKWLQTRKEYKDHVMSEHPQSDEAEKFLGAEKPFVCVYCGQTFKTKYNLQNHQRKHTGERPYKCSDCGKAFRMGTALAIHMQRHSGLRPHKCEICARTFMFKCTLARHMKIHLNIRPHKCNICGRSFINACDVKWHTLHVHVKVPRPTPKKKTEKPKTIVGIIVKEESLSQE